MEKPTRRGAFDVFLSLVERGGNMLPHPASLFALLAAAVVLVSAVAAQLDLSVVHPGTGETVRPVSLLSLPGIHRMITGAVANFAGFAPLGTVLVAMLGIGVAEGSGLFGAALRLLVLSAPRRLLTFVIVLAGIMSNAAGEVGYVLLVPLGASIFQAAGRPPLAGLAAAFAGVSAGYSANLLLGTVDPLLAGLSQEAARILQPGYTVNPAANWYFMSVSTIVLAVTGTWVTERVTVPRVLAEGGEKGGSEGITPLGPAEKRGLRFAGAGALVLAAIVLAGLVPDGGYLRDVKTGDVLHSPFLTGIVSFIFVVGLVLGVLYGLGAGTVRSDADVAKAMARAMESMGLYLVIVFFAAQFVAYFNWTNLGLIVAVEGAGALKASGLGAIPLMVAFVLVSAFINLFMGSASAKWAVMAPVFVPMFMLLGYTPEFTQAAYRIGDSVTNVISPMMTYFALIIAFVQRYKEGAGIGTLVATMLPYTLSFLVAWVGLLVLWVALGLPVGPGAGLYLTS